LSDWAQNGWLRPYRKRPLKIKSLFAVVDRDLAEERAVIENRKLNEYPLPMEHSSGRPKASFSLGLGFRQNQPAVLSEALRRQATRMKS
jgi:hypothetical protein